MVEALLDQLKSYRAFLVLWEGLVFAGLATQWDCDPRVVLDEIAKKARKPEE